MQQEHVAERRGEQRRKRSLAATTRADAGPDARGRSRPPPTRTRGCRPRTASATVSQPKKPAARLDPDSPRRERVERAVGGMRRVHEGEGRQVELPQVREAVAHRGERPGGAERGPRGSRRLDDVGHHRAPRRSPRPPRRGGARSAAPCRSPASPTMTIAAAGPPIGFVSVASSAHRATTSTDRRVQPRQSTSRLRASPASAAISSTSGLQIALAWLTIGSNGVRRAVPAARSGASTPASSSSRSTSQTVIAPITADTHAHRVQPLGVGVQERQQVRGGGDQVVGRRVLPA